MKLNLTFIKLLGILVVVFLLLNPETVPLALFVDAIGIELFMLLIGSQLFSIGSASLQNFMRITVSFLRGFSSYGTLFPERNTLVKNPAALLFAIPSGAALVQLLCLSELANTVLGRC